MLAPQGLPAPITGNAQQLPSEADGLRNQQGVYDPEEVAQRVLGGDPTNNPMPEPATGSSLPTDDWHNPDALVAILQAMGAPGIRPTDQINAPYGSNMRYSPQ